MSNNIRGAIKLVVVLWLCVFVSSCKKKADDSFSITGKYRLVNYDGDTLTSYYLINDDKTYSNLTQLSDGSHAIANGVYQLDEPAVTFSGSLGVVLVSKSGDTLKLIKDSSKPDSYSGNTILVPSTSAPAVTDWIAPVSVISKVSVPDINVSSVAFYLSHIWTCSQYEKRINRYTNTGNEDAVVTTFNEYFGVEWVGTNLWGAEANRDKLTRIDPSTGNTLFTSAAAPGEMHVIAGDGARIYGYNINNSNMYTYSIAGDNFTATHLFDADIRELATLGAYMYASSYNYIYKIDLSTFKIVKTYKVNDVSGVSGLFADGTSLWIYVSDGLYEPGFFAKLNLN